MNRIIRFVLLALAVFSSLGQAKTAAQRVTELNAILPAGKTMRAVWAQGPPWTIKAMSSTDGEIRTIATGSPGMPNLTFDGSRVIYKLNDSECWVVNWDGTNARKVGDCGEAARYWRDRVNNTDWAITVDGMRFNIDAPAQTAVVWNGNPAANVMDYTPLSLSRDGTHCAGHFPHPNWGVGTVPNGPVFTEKSYGSCYATIAPDNTYDIGVQNGPHDTLLIRSSTGAVIKNYPVSNKVLTWANANNGMNGVDAQTKFESIRWGNDRNFVIFHMWATKGNPWVMNLTTMSFMYFDEVPYDSWGCTGTPDMLILPESGTQAPERDLSRAASIGPTSAERGFSLFTIGGRREVGDPSPSGMKRGPVHGIMIRTANTSAQAHPRPVLIP